jgi:hypothetical protein
MRKNCSLLLLVLLAACSGTMELTESEKGKLDMKLQSLMTAKGMASDSDFDMSTDKDGKKIYSIIVRGSSADDVRKLGVNVNSNFGDVITVRCSIDDLKKIAKLPSVRALETPERMQQMK